jgi:hypothetical protein
MSVSLKKLIMTLFFFVSKISFASRALLINNAPSHEWWLPPLVKFISIILYPPTPTIIDWFLHRLCEILDLNLENSECITLPLILITLILIPQSFFMIRTSPDTPDSQEIILKVLCVKWQDYQHIWESRKSIGGAKSSRPKLFHWISKLSQEDYYYLEEHQWLIISYIHGLQWTATRDEKKNNLDRHDVKVTACFRWKNRTKIRHQIPLS